jgi:hypothetical protein
MNCLCITLSLIAFVSRLVLYCSTCAITVSVRGFEEDTGRSLVVSCLQILIVSSIFVTYQACVFLLSELHSATKYRNIRDPEFSAQDDEAQELEVYTHNSRGDLHTETTIARRHTEPTPVVHSQMSDVDVKSIPDRLYLHRVPDTQAQPDCLSRADTSDDIQPSRPDTIETNTRQSDSDSWVFSDATALYRFIIHVHFIGFVLWVTVVGVDFAHPRLMLFFVCGLFAGVMLSQGNSSLKQTPMLLCVFFMYSVLATVLLVICFSCIHIDWSDSPVVLFLFFVSGAGFVWGTQKSSSKIMITAHTAFITTSMMSVPILFLLSTLDDIEYVIHEDLPKALYVLIMEPILKFLNIYVLVISVQTKHAIELSIIFMSILSVSVLFHRLQDPTNIQELLEIGTGPLDVPTPTIIVAIVCIVLLFLIHLSRLCLE